MTGRYAAPLGAATSPSLTQNKRAERH